MGRRRKKVDPADIVLKFVTAGEDNLSFIGQDELIPNFEAHVRRLCGDDEETACKIINNRSKVITLERDRREVKGEMASIFWFVPHPDLAENLEQIFPAPAARSA